MAHDTYIHGTEASEQERLAGLNRLTNRTFLDFLQLAPGMRVLEVGSGLGILAAAVAEVDDGIEVVGLERSGAQIAAAASHPRVTYVQGDAHALKFPNASFDLVYARYVLEHVTGPETVLREMRRVAKPGGRVAVCENDISLIRCDPPTPHFDRTWEAFARLQSSLGGDALIGRRLHRLFRTAGFTSIELSLQPELHWYGSPGFEPWIRNLIGNVESGRRALVEAALSSEDEISKAIDELDALTRNPDASCGFLWNRAVAVR